MMSDSLKIVCWNGAITTYRRNAIIPHHVEEAASLVLRVDMEDERPRVTLLKSRYAPSELCPEWQERRKPQVDAKLIERAREALARWAVVGMTPDGERLFHALRDLLAHLRPEAAKPSTPDFAAMSEQERKAWLDERGRRELWEWVHGKWHARLWERHAMNQLIIKVVAESEPAAILALCEAVAAKERGEDE
jgi:hypothetical protein